MFYCAGRQRGIGEPSACFGVVRQRDRIHYHSINCTDIIYGDSHIFHNALCLYTRRNTLLRVSRNLWLKRIAPLGIKVLIVEPGPFRTEWAGPSLKQSKTRLSDYEQTAGERRAETEARPNAKRRTVNGEPRTVNGER